jgi:hypothetical protein
MGCTMLQAIYFHCSLTLDNFTAICLVFASGSATTANGRNRCVTSHSFVGLQSSVVRGVCCQVDMVHSHLSNPVVGSADKHWKKHAFVFSPLSFLKQKKIVSFWDHFAVYVRLYTSVCLRTFGRRNRRDFCKIVSCVSVNFRSRMKDRGKQLVFTHCSIRESDDVTKWIFR